MGRRKKRRGKRKRSVPKPIPWAREFDRISAQAREEGWSRQRLMDAHSQLVFGNPGRATIPPPTATGFPSGWRWFHEGDENYPFAWFETCGCGRALRASETCTGCGATALPEVPRG